MSEILSAAAAAYWTCAWMCQQLRRSLVTFLRPQSLDHVCVAVASVSRSVDWYTSVLGLTLTHTETDHFWPRCPQSPAFLELPGGTGVALFGSDRLNSDHRGAHFALRVCREDFEKAQHGALFDLLEAVRREGEAPSVVSFHNYGIQHSLFFRDPSGNDVELTHWAA